MRESFRTDLADLALQCIGACSRFPDIGMLRHGQLDSLGQRHREGIVDRLARTIRGEQQG